MWPKLRKNRTTSAVILVILLLASQRAALAQKQEGTVTTQTTGKVTPLADGSKNPESISDDLALRVLFMSIAIPAQPSPVEANRFETKVSRMRLSDYDMKILAEELGRFHTSLTAQQAQVTKAREAAQLRFDATNRAQVIEADARITKLAEDLFTKLLRTMSPSGRASLQEHVRYIKTRIKVIPPPDMSDRHQ